MEKMLKVPLLMMALMLSIFMAVGTANAGYTGHCIAPDWGCYSESEDYCYTCGDTVMSSCIFEGDMTCSDPNPGVGTDHGLTVGATNITIDGADYYIDGVEGRQCVGGETNDAGIYMLKNSDDDLNNVTIKNLKIKNFCHGIWMRKGGPGPDTTGNRIEWCEIHDNGDNDVEGSQTHGIKWNNVSLSVITNCKVYNQGGDPTASGPPGGFGIYLCGGDDNEWCYNEVYDTIKAGLFLRCSPLRAWLHHNYCHDNPFAGIRCQCINDRDFIVEYNDCINNLGAGAGQWLGGYGIFFGGADADPNIARHNVCQGNRVGIAFERDAWVGELYWNTACGNEEWDIYVQDYANVTGDNNTCNTTYNYNDEGTIGCTSSCTYPLAKFNAEPIIICAGGTVDFTDLSMADSGVTGCAIDSWSWDVDGDGQEDYATQNPSHPYNNAGIYDVTLTVTQGGGGCSGSDDVTSPEYIIVCPYKGDFDIDTDVDGADMCTFYNDCLLNPDPPAWCDVNNDGEINASDMDNFGRSDCAFCQ